MAIRETICSRCFQLNTSAKLCKIYGMDMLLCDNCMVAVVKTEKEYQKYAGWIASGEMTAKLEQYRKVSGAQKMFDELARSLPRNACRW